MAKKLSELLAEGRTKRQQCKYALFDTLHIVNDDDTVTKIPLSCDTGAICEALGYPPVQANVTNAFDFIIAELIPPHGFAGVIRRTLGELSMRNDSGHTTEENIAWLQSLGL